MAAVVIWVVVIIFITVARVAAQNAKQNKAKQKAENLPENQTVNQMMNQKQTQNRKQETVRKKSAQQTMRERANMANGIPQSSEPRLNGETVTHSRARTAKPNKQPHQAKPNRPQERIPQPNKPQPQLMKQRIEAQNAAQGNPNYHKPADPPCIYDKDIFEEAVKNTDEVAIENDFDALKQENLLEDVYRVMVTGPDTSIPEGRDFISEGMDMINSFSFGE